MGLFLVSSRLVPLVSFVYPAWFIGRSGQTPGMRQLDIRLFQIDGEGNLTQPSWPRAGPRCHGLRVLALGRRLAARLSLAAGRPAPPVHPRQSSPHGRRRPTTRRLVGAGPMTGDAEGTPWPEPAHERPFSWGPPADETPEAPFTWGPSAGERAGAPFTWGSSREKTPAEIRYARWGRRGAGFLIDFLLMATLPVAFFILFGASTPDTTNPNPPISLVSWVWFWSWLASSTLFVVYPVWFISRRGQTPGMKKMRIRLMHMDVEGASRSTRLRTRRGAAPSRRRPAGSSASSGSWTISGLWATSVASASTTRPPVRSRSTKGSATDRGGPGDGRRREHVAAAAFPSRRPTAARRADLYVAGGPTSAASRFGAVRQ